MEALFDNSAESYDDWYLVEPGLTINRLEKNLVYKLLKPEAGKRLLEIGCGTGNYTLDLAAKGLEVDGLDLSKAMLEKTKVKLERQGLKANLLQADILELQLPLNTYDFVLSVTTLEFIQKPQTVLAKAFTALKPGGKMVIGLIIKSPWSRLYENIAKNKPDSVYRQASFYSLEEIKNFLPDNPNTILKGLYFPPDFSNFNPDKALVLEDCPPKAVEPGFAAVLWRKSIE